MSVYLAPTFGVGYQSFTNTGLVNAGGTVNTFLAGTTTPVATWADNSGLVNNAVSIPLDSAGRLGSPTNVEMWLTSGVPIKIIVKDANGVQVGMTYDNILGINDPSGQVAPNTEWIASGLTPSFINSTSFSVPGDQRALFPVGQRIKATVTAGTAYATVASVSFSTSTTITTSNDGTALDSGLSAVSYGLFNAANPSVSAIGVKYDASITVPASPASIAQPVQRLDRSVTLFTTTGTAPTFILTPTQPLGAYATNAPMMVKFHAASGTTPTLNVSGLGAKSLKQIDGTGTKQPASFAAGVISDVVYDGTDLILLNLPILSGAWLRRTVYTATGTATWTKGVGTTVVNAQTTGGGGGGNSGPGGGGGGGGTAIKRVTSPGSTEVIVLGTGGASAAAGGTTSFGSWCSGLGGAAGGAAAGGVGGAATGGDFTITGGAGSLAGGSFGGAGGGSAVGGGAATAATGGQSTGFSAAANSGGGGGGGSSVGGVGGSGLVVVDEYS